MATIKTTLSIDKSLFEQVEALAEELGVPRSRVFAMALEQFLSHHDSNKLLEQLNAVYAKAPSEDESTAVAYRIKHREIIEGTW